MVLRQCETFDGVLREVRPVCSLSLSLVLVFLLALLRSKRRLTCPVLCRFSLSGAAQKGAMAA